MNPLFQKAKKSFHETMAGTDPEKRAAQSMIRHAKTPVEARTATEMFFALPKLRKRAHEKHVALSRVAIKRAKTQQELEHALREAPRDHAITKAVRKKLDRMIQATLSKV